MPLARSAASAPLRGWSPVKNATLRPLAPCWEQELPRLVECQAIGKWRILGRTCSDLAFATVRMSALVCTWVALLLKNWAEPRPETCIRSFRCTTNFQVQNKDSGLQCEILCLSGTQMRRVFSDARNHSRVCRGFRFSRFSGEKEPVSMKARRLNEPNGTLTSRKFVLRDLCLDRRQEGGQRRLFSKNARPNSTAGDFRRTNAVVWPSRLGGSTYE